MYQYRFDGCHTDTPRPVAISHLIEWISGVLFGKFIFIFLWLIATIQVNHKNDSVFVSFHLYFLSAIKCRKFHGEFRQKIM